MSTTDSSAGDRIQPLIPWLLLACEGKAAPAL